MEAFITAPRFAITPPHFILYILVVITNRFFFFTF